MLIYFNRSRHFFTRPSGGFTLVELLVVSSIILVITAFVLFRQDKFNSSTLQRSLTYKVALSVRQAQVYGTSVRGFTPTGGTEQFSQGYGVYVPSAGATSDTYYIFSDLDSQGDYDVGEALPIFKLGAGFILTGLCSVSSAGGPCASATSLTIYFRRPNPDACFSAGSTNSCAVGTPAAYSRAYITIGNTSNSDTRSIKVTNTGQISVCKPNLTGDISTQC